MKVLKYILSVFCRILAVIYTIVFIPILFILACVAVVFTLIFGIFEWIFTGDVQIGNDIIDWIQDDSWEFIIGIAKKLSNI